MDEVRREIDYRGKQIKGLKRAMIQNQEQVNIEKDQ